MVARLVGNWVYGGALAGLIIAVGIHAALLILVQRKLRAAPG